MFSLVVKSMTMWMWLHMNDSSNRVRMVDFFFRPHISCSIYKAGLSRASLIIPIHKLHETEKPTVIVFSLQ